MTDPVQVISIVVSFLLLLLVLDLVRRKRLTEEYSFVWIVCALALIGLSIGRRLLDSVASTMGIFYPPAVLLLVLVLFVFVASLSFSVVLSRQRQQIERLMEDVAILDARLRDSATARESVGAGRTASRGGG
jgi:hypothetical protein